MVTRRCLLKFTLESAMKHTDYILAQMQVPDIAGINEGTLPRFDYQNLTERRMALLYRQHEVRSQMDAFGSMFLMRSDFISLDITCFAGAVHDIECS